MKKLIYSSVCLLLIFLMISCKKERGNDSKQIVIDASVASGAMYQLNLQNYGDADDVAAITKQGSFFSTSEIVNTARVFAPVYYYSSVTKTAVSDQVVLLITEGGGRCNSHRSTTITINFTIK